jgi:predicted metalloprotease with PDZ domain
MVLDLLIRGRSQGKASLDDVMRAMYDEFYLKSSNNSYYLHGRGYQPEDLERVASRVAGTIFRVLQTSRLRYGDSTLRRSVSICGLAGHQKPMKSRLMRACPCSSITLALP